MTNDELVTGILMGFDDDVEVQCRDVDDNEYEIVDWEEDYTNKGESKLNLVLVKIEKEDS